MGLNAFMKIDTAVGEAKQGKYKDWIEIQSWDWEVEAQSSWTKGSGSSVGKPDPQKFTFEHYYDKSANKILQYISAGKAFNKIEMHMCKTTGSAQPEKFFSIQMFEAFITKVSNSATEDGNVIQKVELVFKQIIIDYLPQDGTGAQAGKLGQSGGGFTYDWNIPEGKTNIA